mmetsp:Transcript_15184/g.22768  ORF Transcript_15184/g.22768 Transcript_15184/m.22768 type:complete len:95 (+) Transcript_15184:3-287(+)
MAAEGGHLPICRLLLEHRADVNVWDTRHFRSPLDCASTRGHEGVAELLRGHGARNSPCTFTIFKKAPTSSMTTSSASSSTAIAPSTVFAATSMA